jgi:hypothetical protein
MRRSHFELPGAKDFETSKLHPYDSYNNKSVLICRVHYLEQDKF